MNAQRVRFIPPSNARGSETTGARLAGPDETPCSANILRGTLPGIRMRRRDATEMSQITRAKAVVVRRAAVDYSREPHRELNHVNRASDFNR
ncbi:protein of unknown function [Azospirillum lipoferum 4B]|uniref:Uncharacterized protein n=1 Tax=Azospirillum lipoferum (strain 4B) TaxID=862719 RepID=G7Z4K7_AZOL4|nr:protein of unknown function [Azospirillum lipoferum 4B]